MVASEQGSEGQRWWLENRGHRNSGGGRYVKFAEVVVVDHVPR